MDQQQAWNREYQNAQGVPTSTRTTPSSAVRRLIDYIAQHKIEIGKEAIDLGCGMGRNSLYLAEQGYHVTAVDFADGALKKLHRTLKNSPQVNKIVTKQINLADPMPFADNTFDLATDIVTTMTLKPEEMPGFEAELRRVVCPNGLFLTYVLSRDDGYLEAAAPGKAVTTVEESGITDNYFGEEQLKNLYKKWKILEIDKIEKTDFFYGKNYTRRIWWLLLQNTKH